MKKQKEYYSPLFDAELTRAFNELPTLEEKFKQTKKGDKLSIKGESGLYFGWQDYLELDFIKGETVYATNHWNKQKVMYHKSNINNIIRRSKEGIVEGQIDRCLILKQKGILGFLRRKLVLEEKKYE